jgi:uncharacterized membrane protein
MLPRADVIALSMSVDEALKYVISMGVVAPHVKRDSRPMPLPNLSGCAPPRRSARHRSRRPQPLAAACKGAAVRSPRQEHGVTR